MAFCVLLSDNTSRFAAIMCFTSLFQISVCLMAILASDVTALPQRQSTARPEISDEALEMTLNDSRYLMRQLKCALGEAPCDPVGRRLKSKRSLCRL